MRITGDEVLSVCFVSVYERCCDVECVVFQKRFVRMYMPYILTMSVSGGSASRQIRTQSMFGDNDDSVGILCNLIAFSSTFSSLPPRPPARPLFSLFE